MHTNSKVLQLWSFHLFIISLIYEHCFKPLPISHWTSLTLHAHDCMYILKTVKKSILYHFNRALFETMHENQRRCIIIYSGVQNILLAPVGSWLSLSSLLYKYRTCVKSLWWARHWNRNICTCCIVVHARCLIFFLCLLWRINFLIAHACISMICHELSFIFKYIVKSCTFVLITDPMFFLTETTLSTKKTLKPSTGGQLNL